jgi:hypothetical protein
MSTQTFADRCTLSEQCLPDAPYRAMLTKLHVEMLQEIERLNKALTWEQNRAERIGTHAPGCHTWGPAHYECLLRVNAELLEAMKRSNTLLAELTFSEWIPKSDSASIDIRQRINAAHVIASSALAKATGETK